MITIKKNHKIYILCPANFATGGPEALHQLAAQLRKMEIDAQMYYVNYDEGKFHTPVHKEYEKYAVPYVLQVENFEGNWLLFPETFCFFICHNEYSNLKKIIWWLSVTNYHISMELHYAELQKKKKFFALKKLLNLLEIPTISRLQKSGAYHIAHSYFSVDFLRKNRLPIVGQISDYMKDCFLKNEQTVSQKKDIAIYNPLKNKGFLEKVLEQSPDVTWVPIENMTSEEVVETMKKAKVYVDFGYHPGKERMPRESCLMDCCMVIGKDGSAKYKEDMPIADRYHFEKNENNIPNIIETVKDCIQNYEERIVDFKDYKNTLLQEKATFEKDVAAVFKADLQ